MIKGTLSETRTGTLKLTILGNAFAWSRDPDDAKGHIAIAEASDLALPVGVWPGLIDVVSHKTGAIRRFFRIDTTPSGTVRYACALKRDWLKILND